MILGLDPSLSSTGYCIMNEEQEIATLGKIVTKVNKKTPTEEDRLFVICDTLDKLIKEHGVTRVALEAQFLHKNPKTTMILSRLRGALGYMLKVNSCTIEHFPPSSVRKILMDDGSADKEEVAQYIQDKYKDSKYVVELGEFCDRNCKAKNSDIYDAIAVATAFTAH